MELSRIQRTLQDGYVDFLDKKLFLPVFIGWIHLDVDIGILIYEAE